MRITYQIAIMVMLAIANLSKNRQLLTLWWVVMALQSAVWGIMMWKRTGLRFLAGALVFSAACFTYYAVQIQRGINLDGFPGPILLVMAVQLIVATACVLLELRFNGPRLTALRMACGSTSESLWGLVSGQFIPNLR